MPLASCGPFPLLPTPENRTGSRTSWFRECSSIRSSCGTTTHIPAEFYSMENILEAAKSLYRIGLVGYILVQEMLHVLYE